MSSTLLWVAVLHTVRFIVFWTQCHLFFLIGFLIYAPHSPLPNPSTAASGASVNQ